MSTGQNEYVAFILSRGAASSATCPPPPPANEDIGALFDKYGSDKNRNGYTPIYHTILKRIRNDVASLLEVGVGTMIPGAPSSMVGYSLPGYRPGGSLRAFRDYLPVAEIVGVDVAEDCMFEDERIKTMRVDSRDAAQTERALEGRTFDVIIDDGLHAHDAQLATMRNFLPRVRPGGYYVVEDIYPGSPFFDGLGGVASVVLRDARWFTTANKNIAVFSLP